MKRKSNFEIERLKGEKMERIFNFTVHLLIFFCLFTCTFFLPTNFVQAKKKIQPEKILYIPHDNRPIVDEQTIAVIEKVGYQVVAPPEEFLGNREKFGEPDKLWKWLEENCKKDIRAAIISSDSMLYGSLVASRKHNIDKQVILDRVELFQEFRKKHKKLPIYVFGSIMRTPRSAEASGYEEPDYYRNYGANIFRYTALEDKKEVEGLNPREQKEIDFLQKLIPKKALGDWKERHEKNFSANEKLIDLARAKNFNCLLLGRDDNAPYSQTHMESRHLKKYGTGLEQNKFQTIAGIDEVGLMLLTRAVNDRTKNIPAVFVKYNFGRGAETVPSYSDEKIGDTIGAEILAVGGRQVYDVGSADLILAVNTNSDGQTHEAATSPLNGSKERPGTEFFVDIIQEFLNSDKSVALADISFANGSDNALMELLNKRGILFRLNAYSGWNTATNSTGFALSSGILSKRMTYSDKKNLLTTRYLDDWAYQSNVRNVVAGQIKWLRGNGVYESLDEKIDIVTDETSEMLNHFVKNNLQSANIVGDLKVKFPWNRMFESKIIFATEQK